MPCLAFATAIVPPAELRTLRCGAEVTYLVVHLIRLWELLKVQSSLLVLGRLEAIREEDRDSAGLQRVQQPVVPPTV